MSSITKAADFIKSVFGLRYITTSDKYIIYRVFDILYPEFPDSPELFEPGARSVMTESVRAATERQLSALRAKNKLMAFMFVKSVYYSYLAPRSHNRNSHVSSAIHALTHHAALK